MESTIPSLNLVTHPDTKNIKKAEAKLQTKTVKNLIGGYKLNRVLSSLITVQGIFKGQPEPPVHNYARDGPQCWPLTIIDHSYQLCGVSPHNTNHLFNCPAEKTKLSALDLWNNR